MRSSTERAIEKSELDYFFEERIIDHTISANFNVLDFWKSNKARFPCLSKIACDILCITITTAASELAFSIGSRVLTIFRSSIIPENVEALICAQNQLVGFLWNGNITNYIYYNIFVVQTLKQILLYYLCVIHVYMAEDSEAEKREIAPLPICSNSENA